MTDYHELLSRHRASKGKWFAERERKGEHTAKQLEHIFYLEMRIRNQRKVISQFNNMRWEHSNSWMKLYAAFKRVVYERNKLSGEVLELRKENQKLREQEKPNTGSPPLTSHPRQC